MKEITKNILAKIISIAAPALFIFVSFPSYSQDLILDTYMMDDYSIIRNIDDDHWLVYSNGKGNAFYMISSSGATITHMDLAIHKLKILDFEIFENTVYFCGVNDTISPNALMGYFNLSGFPYSAVRYDVRSEWMSFGKLDVFRVENEIHIVMTAKYHSGNGTMVDVRSLSFGNWAYCDGDFDKVHFTFYDVAVTENYVVYTSIGDSNSTIIIPNTKLWYIKRPTSSGGPIFNNVPGYMQIVNLCDSVASSPILIEHIIHDTIIVASKNNITPYIHTTCLNGLNYILTSRIPIAYYGKLVDIKKCDSPKDITILVTNTFDPQSAISSIIHAHATWPSSTYNEFYRLSYSELFNSIDYIPGDVYSGSGHGYINNNLHAYRLGFTQGFNCFGREEYKGYIIENDVDKYNVRFPHNFYPYPDTTMNKTKGTLDPEIICE